MAPQPKYQAICDALRQQVLSGHHPPGARLPSQAELAARFGVTLMTLRQALAALEAEGLVRAERGRGTFVVDRPVDLRLGNLSSFAAQMRAAGVDLVTEVLAVDHVSASEEPEAAVALGIEGELTVIRRRRSVGGAPVAVQRSLLPRDLIAMTAPEDLGARSLYETIAAATGREVVEARESITAVVLDADQSRLLDAPPGAPALRSVRTSIDQFGSPVVHDDAVLVGERCAITADRTADRLSLVYGSPSATQVF